MTSRFVLPLADVGAGITPSSGAKLFFYETGTTTPKDTYSDSAGTTPNANPVVANSLGQFPDIFITGTYKVVLKNSSDVQSWAADPIDEYLISTDLSASNGSLLTTIVNSTTIKEGESYTITDRGYGVFDVVLASSVTPNTFNIVQCVGAPTLALVLRVGDVANVKQFGAVGDNSNDDTAAIQSAIDYTGEFQTLYLPPGQYVITAELDFTGKKNFSVKGEFRATRLKVAHTSSATFNFYNDSFTTGGTPQRGILIENISIYPQTTTSAMPLRGMRIRNCPEIKVQNCTLINCGSVASLEIDECWDAVVTFNFISCKENLTSTHGAPYNTSAGGIAIFVPSECHAMTITYNRVRTGSPGISYGGGDATEIRLNAIESNLTAGVTIAGSCQAITIDRNYFEGGQPWDIIYTPAGTNFSHTVSGNYFHAVAGVKIETGCDCNNLNITKNQFYSGSTSIEIQSGTTHKNIVIEDNLHRDMGETYDFNIGDFVNIGLSYPANRIKINDSEIGSTSGANAYPSKNPMGIVFGAWQTFSGSGTSPDSADYHDGILMYDLTSGSSWSTFCQYPLDNTLKDAFITVNIPIKSSAGANYTVNISDGTVNKNYTCNSSTSEAIDSLFYFRTGASATTLQVKISIGAEVVKVLIPSVRKGLHNDVYYRDIR